MPLADDDTNSILADDAIGQFGVDGCHLDGGRAQCGLGLQALEIARGVSKVVVQELHGILELVCW